MVVVWGAARRWTMSRLRRPAIVCLPLAGIVACETALRQPRVAESPGVADAGATTEGSPDTVVRRVARVVRRPWMIQRVTGRIGAEQVRALEPLDSVFVLRVLDQRGAELSGVSVDWTPVNPAAGARLEVVNALTDSLGESRVVFTPGLTASPQGARAAVEDVAGLDFVVRVPAAAVELTPPRDSVWSGAELTLVASLRDSAGRSLSGGRVSWRSRDTTVAVVTPIDSLRARVQGRLTGHALVVATADSARDTAAVLVKPVLDMRVVMLDGSPTPPLQLELEAGRVRELLRSDAGEFSARLDIMPETEIDLRLAPPAGAAVHAVSFRTENAREAQEMVIALVPTSWRIERGTYAGAVVPIEVEAAVRRAGSGSAFWRIAPRRGAPRQIIGWPEAAFPLRIAFDHRKSREPITAADSVAFWAAARQMEIDLGAKLFEPADMPREWSEVIPVEIRDLTEAGHTGLTWTESGDVYDGVLSFRHAATLRDAHVVTHELLHLLGFGHAASWRSVVAMGGEDKRLSRDDVAYAQLAASLRRLYARSRARVGISVPLRP